MEINRNNYEAYLLDMVENRLSAKDQQVVRDFLLLNPDLEADLKEANLWTLEKSWIQFPSKDGLKKEFPDASSRLTEDSFDIFSIARLEGDLTVQQEEDHDSMMAGDENLRSEWIKWQKTRLSAENITFTDRDHLKKSKGLNRRVIWLSVISSAAAIALVITLLRINFIIPEAELTEQVSSEQTDGSLQPAILQPEPDGNEAAALADHPATLSIRKFQDPPELTGIKKGASDTMEKSDTVQKVSPKQTESRPVRIAVLDQYIMEAVDRGHYDQITPIEIPATSIHLTSLSISQLAELDLQEIVQNYAEVNDISFWNIANAGLKGINRITGGDMSLLASRDSEGDVSGLRFKSKRLSVATPIESSE